MPRIHVQVKVWEEREEEVAGSQSLLETESYLADRTSAAGQLRLMADLLDPRPARPLYETHPRTIAGGAVTASPH